MAHELVEIIDGIGRKVKVRKDQKETYLEKFGPKKASPKGKSAETIRPNETGKAAEAEPAQPAPKPKTGRPRKTTKPE